MTQTEDTVSSLPKVAGHDDQFRIFVDLSPDVLLQSVQDGITVQDRLGNLVFANLAAARLSGFGSTEAFLAAPYSEFISRFNFSDASGECLEPENLPGRRVLRGEEAGETIVRFTDPDSGETRWSQVRASPIRDVNGEVQLVVNVFQDVTERMRSAETQGRLAAIVQASDDAIIGKDLDARILSWNPAAERLYGYSAEEAIGKMVSMLVPPDRLHELSGIMEQIKRGERIDRIETVRVAKNGQHLVVALSVFPIHDAAGNVIGAAATARDISERKQAQAARAALLVQEREARSRAEAAQKRLQFLAEASEILSSSLDYETTLANVARLAVPALADWCLIDVVEQDGSVRRVALAAPNPETEAFIREFEERRPSNRAGPHPTDPIVTGKSLLVPEITDEMLAAGAGDEEQLAATRSLGFKSAMGVPLIARGNIVGQVGLLSTNPDVQFDEDDLALAEDLARRAAVAVDNARLYMQTQEALRLREEFLSIASHELKTPLTALHLQTQMLNRLMGTDSPSDASPDRVRSTLDGIVRQTRRLARLVNELLDVSRMGAGKLDLELEDMDVSTVARDVADRFRDEAAAAGSSVTVVADPMRIRADRFRLDQVITNLLANALKYGEGSPIDISVSRDGRWAVVAVRDRGIGIASDQIERVFDRFERVARSQNYAGLGLGLYIAKQIVEAHGGTISVTSEPGVGSTFTVRLAIDPDDTVHPREHEA